MARLIDANTLKAQLKRLPMMSNWGEAFISILIDEQPTINPVHAAGACYCRECRFADIGGNDVESWCYCKVKYRNIYPTDFCSYGQLREGSQCEK